MAKGFGGRGGMGMASWYVIAGAIPKSRKHPCAFWNRRWLMA